MPNIIGICPAAGQAARLGHIPASKELITVGFQQEYKEGQTRYYPKPISQYLVESMIQSGAEKVFFVIGPGKYDLLNFYGNGSRFNVQIAYLFQEKLDGMPFAIDLSYSWITEKTTTLFGMPDTLIEPRNAFEELLEVFQQNDDDVTLGLFQTNKPHKFGMVETKGRDIIHIVDKPAKTSLKYLWGIAVWGYEFSSLMHNYLKQKLRKDLVAEVVLGDVFVHAIANGLKVRGHKFNKGFYLDIGTADGLYGAMSYILKQYPHPKE